jgi:hypothetical protein
MVKTITSKSAIDRIFNESAVKENDTPKNYADFFLTKLFKKKIKFPFLEYATIKISELIPDKSQIDFLNEITAHKALGGNVVAGKMLQLRMEKYFKPSFEKAVEYIIAGNEWYVCDIIGERVMGHGLLFFPEQTIPVLKKYAKDENSWTVRTIGVATHYATKKGLKKIHVEEMFRLLLSLSASTDFHVKTGTGWGAKTCVKFYPDLADKYEKEIMDEKTGQWFRTKISIGLGRAFKYAGKFD